MLQMQNAQPVELQPEKVHDKCRRCTNGDGILLTMIQQRGDIEWVNSRNMRPVLQIRITEGNTTWARGHSFREISDLHRRAAIVKRLGGEGIENFERKNRA